MTDLWQWFALGIGYGVGSVFGWYAFKWLAMVGNASRHLLTLPDESLTLRADVVHLIRKAGEARGRPYPEWYVQWVAFRECAYLW